jgi:hypothetical protein
MSQPRLIRRYERSREIKIQIPMLTLLRAHHPIIVQGTRLRNITTVPPKWICWTTLKDSSLRFFHFAPTHSPKPTVTNSLSIRSFFSTKTTTTTTTTFHHRWSTNNYKSIISSSSHPASSHYTSPPGGCNDWWHAAPSSSSSSSSSPQVGWNSFGISSIKRRTKSTLKTNKSAAKRFRVRGSGSIKR